MLVNNFLGADGNVRLIIVRLGVGVGLGIRFGVELGGAPVWWPSVGLFSGDISIVFLCSGVGFVSENRGKMEDILVFTLNLD